MRKYKNNQGVYQIKSEKTNRIYIGSTINFKKREYAHYQNLEKGRHINSRLQRYYNRYGKEDLVFSILEITSIGINQKKLFAREQYYIDKLKPTFNLCINAGSLRGVTRIRKKQQALYYDNIIEIKRLPHLKMIRRRFKWSQTILAEKAKVSFVNISTLETQRSASPHANTRRDIELAFKQRIDWIKTLGMANGEEESWEDLENDLRTVITNASCLPNKQKKQFIDVIYRYVEHLEDSY